MKIVIDIPEDFYNYVKKQVADGIINPLKMCIANGTPLPKGHGRLGDLDELEKRISNYVEHDAKITDEYTVARQRFIVAGIRDTPTIIEADKAESGE